MYGLKGAMYGSCVAEIINNVRKGSIDQPPDLNVVSIMANTKVVASWGLGHSHSSTFSTIEEYTNFKRCSEVAQMQRDASATKKKSADTKTSTNKSKSSNKNETNERDSRDESDSGYRG